MADPEQDPNSHNTNDTAAAVMEQQHKTVIPDRFNPALVEIKFAAPTDSFKGVNGEEWTLESGEVKENNEIADPFGTNSFLGGGTKEGREAHQDAEAGRALNQAGLNTKPDGKNTESGKKRRDKEFAEIVTVNTVIQDAQNALQDALEQDRIAQENLARAEANFETFIDGDKANEFVQRQADIQEMTKDLVTLRVGFNDGVTGITGINHEGVDENNNIATFLVGKDPGPDGKEFLYYIDDEGNTQRMEMDDPRINQSMLAQLNEKNALDNSGKRYATPEEQRKIEEGTRKMQGLQEEEDTAYGFVEQAEEAKEKTETQVETARSNLERVQLEESGNTATRTGEIRTPALNYENLETKIQKMIASNDGNTYITPEQIEERFGPLNEDGQFQVANAIGEAGGILDTRNSSGDVLERNAVLINNTNRVPADTVDKEYDGLQELGPARNNKPNVEELVENQPGAQPAPGQNSTPTPGA